MHSHILGQVFDAGSYKTQTRKMLLLLIVESLDVKGELSMVLGKEKKTWTVRAPRFRARDTWDMREEFHASNIGIFNG